MPHHPWAMLHGGFNETGNRTNDKRYKLTFGFIISFIGEFSDGSSELIFVFVNFFLRNCQIIPLVKFAIWKIELSILDSVHSNFDLWTIVFGNKVNAWVQFTIASPVNCIDIEKLRSFGMRIMHHKINRNVIFRLDLASRVNCS